METVLEAASTETQPRPVTPHPDVKPLTPEEIDGVIADYEYAKKVADSAKADLDQAKEHLVFLADNFGQRPPHAEQSLRLEGRRNAAVVTRGTTVSVDESAVAELKRYLGELGTGIFERLFAAQTKHTLIEGAKDLLKKLSLPRRTEEKVLSLFGRCIDLKTKSPSVKVEVITPEKPTRKPRGKKAA